MRIRFLSGLAMVTCAFALLPVARGQTVPDNGSGTADMPIHLPYTALRGLDIIDGLPPGTTVHIDAVLTAPGATAEQPGGALGGTQSAANGNGLQWHMTGTGALAGYDRVLFMPLGGGGGIASFAAAPPGSGIEVNAAPRTPGAPVQAFNTEVFRMFGQITGDPDFDLLRITAGADFGLPSPGHTTLTSPGGGPWAVDSFFDITYRIDFVGHPGGPFQGLSGSTTGTDRFSVVPEPTALSVLGVGMLGLLRRRRRCIPVRDT